MTAQLGFSFPRNISYDKANDKVVSALKSDGFGVLTRTDVKATFGSLRGISN